MNRACALLVLLVVVLGGCLSGGSVDAPETTVATPSQSVEFPSKPAALTTESVAAYVESYERAYRKREIYDRFDADGTTVKNVQISMHDVSVEERGERAFIVTLRYMAGYTTERSDEPVAADRRFTAKYYVSTSTTRRDATTGIDGSGLEPVENGTEVDG